MIASNRKVFQNCQKILITAFLLFFSLKFGWPKEIALSWESPPRQHILDNGLKLIYQRDGSSSITVIQILILGGKRADPVKKHGLAYLTTRLALEIPDEGKVRELMGLSSRYSMTCRGDYSLINLQCLSQNLEDTLKIVTKILLDPLFSGIRDNTKKYMLHQNKLREDDAIQMAHNIQLKSLLGDKGYGGSIFGEEETLNAIKGKDISEYYENYFQAPNMIVSVSSDLEDEKIIGIVQKYVSKFLSGKTIEFAPQALSTQQKSYSIEKETKQSLVSLAFPLPKISNKNYVLGCMLDTLVGKGVGSRLWPLRSKEKLAYNVNSQVTQMKGGGMIEAYLETDNQKKDLALEALKKVIITLCESEIPDEELPVIKINAKANFLRSNETKEARTATLAYFEALGLGYEFLTKFFAELEAVSPEEINAYIKAILLPEKAVEVIVGPRAKD